MFKIIDPDTNKVVTALPTMDRALAFVRGTHFEIEAL